MEILLRRNHRFNPGEQSLTFADMQWNFQAASYSPTLLLAFDILATGLLDTSDVTGPT